MFEGVDLKTLYRLHWGARGSGEAYERLVREDFEPRRLRLQREAEQRAWIRPTAVYGFFPVQGEGQELVVYDPSGFAGGSLTPRGKLEELLRFTFPRQADREGLCLSDYFVPADTSRFDVLAVQVVTVGPYVDELRAALDERGEYSEALFVHGLGVAAAEGLAEWHHQRIRRELGIAPDRGKRYSFGYSACPDLADQAKLFRLLKPAETIDVTLTSAYQLVPEASTSAIIVHHPQAAYYMVRT
jgi:5-methyltetrahydrofolate--homocysteine methyltransferase